MRDDECGTDTLDRQIDAALRSYAEPGKIPEARVVLAGVLEQARTEGIRKRARWVWGLGIPAFAGVVAVLVIAFVLRLPRVPQIAWVPSAPGVVESVPRQIEAESRRGRSGTTAAGLVQEQRHAGQSRAIVDGRLPKQEVFPTPRPLSEQEKALVAFAVHGPPEVKRAVLEDQKHWEDPIIVAGLQEQQPEAGTPQKQ